MPHALIIEDEMIIAIELEHLLREEGYDSFDIADSPPAALEQALRRRPDLITADVRIIGGTGIEAVAEIEARLGKIAVVYVTGNVDMLRSLEAPAVVEKPISPRALTKACREAQSVAGGL
ncbi:response regulator [Phenylobacterium sp.]|jgi:CheY-like chemotaxis protein|uniref:response regulator n=1 Tax=Phenylobacterium sp. TaxID=1871053 RepID=UPI002F95FEB6